MKNYSLTHARGNTVVRLVMVITLLLLLAGLPQHQARAASTRYAKPTGVTSGACLSWGEACRLWYAIQQSAAGDEIWVQEGTHFPSALIADRTQTIQLKTGVAIYGGFVLGATSMAQRDPAAHVTILSGAIGLPADPSDNSRHVVTGSGVDTTAVLDGFTITLGYASGTGANQTLGAGLLILNGSPTLRNIVFSNHTATNGGAVYNSGGSPVFDRVTFLNNTSSGNGAALWNGNGAAPTLTNVTFTGGDAGGSGGGIYNDHSSPILNNVTFNNNVAASGGAMTNVNASAPTIRNSILWGDTASSNPEIRNLDTSTAAVTYSVVEGGYAGTGNTSADPLLGPPGNYGGSLQLIPLLPGSSAIDTGDATTCASVDGRDIARPQVNKCDRGAFESQGFTLAVVSGNNQTTNVNTAFPLPLVASISSAFGEPVNGGLVHFSALGGPFGADCSPSFAPITSGSASTTATARAYSGSYSAVATTSGALVPAMFHLTNTGGLTPFYQFLPSIFRG